MAAAVQPSSGSGRLSPGLAPTHRMACCSEASAKSARRAAISSAAAHTRSWMARPDRVTCVACGAGGPVQSGRVGRCLARLPTCLPSPAAPTASSSISRRGSHSQQSSSCSPARSCAPPRTTAAPPPGQRGRRAWGAGPPTPRSACARMEMRGGSELVWEGCPMRLLGVQRQHSSRPPAWQQQRRPSHDSRTRTGQAHLCRRRQRVQRSPALWKLSLLGAPPVAQQHGAGGAVGLDAHRVSAGGRWAAGSRQQCASAGRGAGPPSGGWRRRWRRARRRRRLVQARPPRRPASPPTWPAHLGGPDRR